MKKAFYVLTIVASVCLYACGGKGGSSNASADAQKQEAATTEKMTINDADWVETDLSSVSSMTPVLVRLPKDAKMEKNGNGGVDIKIGNSYMLTVSNLASSSVKEAMDSDKSLTVNTKSGYKNQKTEMDEAMGFVYTYQMNDEANGTTYEPESHFFAYVEKDGAIYSIKDDKQSFDVKNSFFTADMAKQVYGIVKSMKVK